MGKMKGFFKRAEKFSVRCKQRLIMHHLLRRAGGKELIARYTRDYVPVYEPITETSPVWTCWWQGEDAMPDIARACLNAMRLKIQDRSAIFSLRACSVAERAEGEGQTGQGSSGNTKNKGEASASPKRLINFVLSCTIK